MKPKNKPPLRCRKIGHLFQAAIGYPGREIYGYGVTRALATAEARKGMEAK